MENFFEKIKNDIITGAESAYFGGDETPELTDAEIAEHFDESNREFKELAVMVAAEPLESLKDADEIISAEKIIAAGGEAATEAIKQKGYAVKKIANRGYDKVLKFLKGLMGWFTGSSADFKKLASTAKALSKRLDKLVLPAEKDDNKITIKKYDISKLVALVTRATGNSGRLATTSISYEAAKGMVTALVAVDGKLLKLDTAEDKALTELDSSDTLTAALGKVKKFNEGNYLDSVKDYLETLKADDDEEVAPNAALTTVKGYLKTIGDSFNFNNKVTKDFSKLISNIEKAAGKTKDEKESGNANAAAEASQLATSYASAVITYRKSALQACSFAKKELNNAITLGYRIESMGKKTK